MNKIKYIIILVCVAFFSCDSDELELVDQNGLNSDTFMQSEAQAIDAITATYDVLSHIGMYRLAFITLGEIPTDNIINVNGDGSYGPDMIRLNAYNWDGNNRYFTERWNAGYKGIARANFVLDNIDKVTNFSSEAKRNEIEGQALFLRAFYYYSLVAGFGDIPLVTTVLSPADANSVSKAPEAEVWAQIEEDLAMAAQLLPASYPAEEVGRVTKGSAYGLLSRVKLWTQDYEGAEAAATSVESLNYQLLATDDYVKMFDGRMENSAEAVFEVQFYPGGPLWQDERSETTLLMHIFPRVSWAVYLIPRQTDTYDIVTEAFEAGDMRREASMLIAGQDEIFYVSADRMSVFPDLTIHSDFRLDLQTDGAYQMRKFLPYDTENWARGGAPFTQGTSLNIPVVRYAEVILNKAEALVMQGKTAEAWTELEKIRTRAGLDMTGISNSDQTALLEQIKKDRRVELMFEGHRWFDLKRWGDLDSALGAAGLSYGGQTTWNIPQQEKDVNPNL